MVMLSRFASESRSAPAIRRRHSMITSRRGAPSSSPPPSCGPLVSLTVSVGSPFTSDWLIQHPYLSEHGPVQQFATVPRPAMVLHRRPMAPAGAEGGTSGTALGVPHEGPGIEALTAAGTARNENRTLPGEGPATTGRRVSVVQGRPGTCSRLFPSIGGATRARRNHRYSGDGSDRSKLFQSDTDDRNAPEPRQEPSAKPPGGTGCAR